MIQTKKRQKLIRLLKNKGIGSAIHYPIPIHLQPAAKYLNYRRGSFPEVERQASQILTIPIHQNLTKKELNWIVLNLNNFN